MFKKESAKRDAFTFSLSGATTITSFAAAPAIASNRINRMLDECIGQNADGHGLNEPHCLAPQKQAA
jgi:hypothetical protein